MVKGELFGRLIHVNTVAGSRNRFAELFGAALAIYNYSSPFHKFSLQLIYIE